MIFFLNFNKIFQIFKLLREISLIKFKFVNFLNLKVKDKFKYIMFFIYKYIYLLDLKVHDNKKSPFYLENLKIGFRFSLVTKSLQLYLPIYRRTSNKYYLCSFICNFFSYDIKTCASKVAFEWVINIFHILIV